MNEEDISFDSFGYDGGSESMQPKPKCYSYIRFSTPGQIKGDSLRRQTELAEKWAKDNGYVLDDSLRLQDLGVSGFSGANRAEGTAFAGFMEQVKQGLIVPGSVLLVESLDRLSREQVIDSFPLVLNIIRDGIKIVSLCDKIEYDRESINKNPMNLMYSLVTLTRGHEESETKSKRVRAAWANKRATLDKKKLTSRCPAWLTLSEDRTRFDIIPERAKIIQQIFEMKRDGVGVLTITKTLNKQRTWLPPGRSKLNEPPVSPSGWRESYIQKLLRFRAVIGEFQPRVIFKDSGSKRRTKSEGDSIPDYFPRIIADDLFYAVQDQLKQNHGKGGKNGVVSNLFGHIAKCGYCGAPMAFVGKGPAPKGGTYLLCDAARRGIGCVRHPVRYPEFESLMIEFCQGLDARDVLPNNEQIDTEARQVDDRLAGVRGKLADLEAKASNYMATIGSAPDSRVRERAEKELSAILDKIDELAAEEKELAQSIKRLSNLSQATSEQLNDIKAVIVGEDSAVYRERLRAKLRQLIKQITIYPAGSNRRMYQNLIKDLAPEVAQQVMVKLDAGEYDDRERRVYVVRFATGNWSRIEPSKPGSLIAEYDKNTGKTISIDAWGPNGEPIVNIDCEEVKDRDFAKYAPRKK